VPNVVEAEAEQPRHHFEFRNVLAIVFRPCVGGNWFFAHPLGEVARI
jgi:hypothetical protein